MKDIVFAKDYRHIPELRAALNRRLREIFGFDMEKLYDAGSWSGVYIPYSFVSGGEIAANASAIVQDFVFDGIPRKGVLIESVMSAPEFRGQGLADRLMRMILNEYTSESDFICLYSKPGAVGFYTRFGFSRVLEHRYVVKRESTARGALEKRKLDLSRPDDLAVFDAFFEKSAPVSQKFSVTGDKAFLKFELTAGGARDMLWHLSGIDAIVAAEKRDSSLYVNHVLSEEIPGPDDIMKYFPCDTQEPVLFGYTPDEPSAFAAEFVPIADATFFIKSKFEFTGNFMLPHYTRS